MDALGTMGLVLIALFLITVGIGKWLKAASRDYPRPRQDYSSPYWDEIKDRVEADARARRRADEFKRRREAA